MYLGTQIKPRDDSDYRVWAQLGVTHVCGDPPGNPHDWSSDDLKRQREHVERFWSSLDVMQLPLSDGDRRLLASVLMSEHEELTAELLEEAVMALRRRQLEQRQRVIKTLIANAEHSKDASALTRLVQEKQEIDRALAS